MTSAAPQPRPSDSAAGGRFHRGGHLRLALLVVLGAWVLVAHTYGEFTRVRDVVVRDPVVARPSVRIPLLGVADSSDPYLVLIFRARNDDDVPLTVTATAAGQALGQSSIAPRSSQRVDLAWLRVPTAEAREIELHGDRAGWTLEAAEIANVHGFTRGAFNFVILPHQQPFDGAPRWVWVVGVLCTALAQLYGPARLSRWPSVALRMPAAAIVLLFLATVASPLVSSFRIVLAAHTVALGFAILGAWGFWRLGALVARRIAIASRALMRWGRTVLRPAIARAKTMATIVPWFKVATVAAVVAYASFLWPNIGSSAGGADSSGYLGSARFLLEGRVRAPVRALPGAPAQNVAPTVYMPLGFRTVGSSEIAASYPVGLPILVAAVPAADLETKAAVVMAAHAVMGAWLVFWLALQAGLSRYTAALAALLLATSPVYLLMSLTVMSDVPALVWTTAAVTAMWRSRRNERWALAAGAALSLAVLIRHTNVLAFVPIAACAGLSARRWLLLAAGGAPGAILFFAYNIGAYDAVIATGYVDHGIHFGAKHILPSLWHYAVWLPAMLTPIVVLALALPALRKTSTLPTVLMLWIAVYLGFFTTYSYTNDTWWYTRFLLPAFPALIVGALLVGRTARDRIKHAIGTTAVMRVARRVPAVVGPTVLGAAIIAPNIWWAERLGVVPPTRPEAQYVTAAGWVRTHLPPGSGIVSMQMSGSLFHYTSFPVLRWEFVDGDLLRSLERDSTSGRHPLYAVLHPFDFELEVADRLQGNWVQVAEIDGITVWRFDGLTEGTGSIPADQRWFPLKGSIERQPLRH